MKGGPFGGPAGDAQSWHHRSQVMTVPSGVGKDQHQQQEESEQGSPWRRGLGPSWDKEYMMMLAAEHC